MIVLFNFVYRKMRPPICVLMSLLLMITDGFTVHGTSGPLVVPLGSSVVLPCYVDKALSSEGLEVEWRRTDSETLYLVHLYQDGESRPEAQQQEYHYRAHFFTDQIQHGNFSLRLDNLRAEDEGKYTCKVYSQQGSGETVITLKSAERLLVSGSSRSISASVGEDVTLNCSVDSHIPPTDIEEVSWKKTDEDILVVLYQSNKTLPDSSDEKYRDRVEFFTDEIPKGNFSLRLKSVRTEDKGVYMCQVFAGGASANATVVLERLGFSALQIMVLILCVSGSGSALLLCSLIYCRTQNGFTVIYSQDTLVDLGSSVVLRCFSVNPLQVEDLKVEWRRTDTKALVHLYEDGESRPEKQHEDYHDRVHFFTDQIQHGNFSLCLDKLRAEDKGEYTCTVYSQQDCVFSTQITLEVKVSSATLVVPLGSSVVLSCYCDECLPSKGLKVEWRKTDSKTDTDSDSETLVHLYQDGESRPEVQQQEYHDRAHFFTDQIQHGNLSLRLDKLRAGDEGKYTCTVYSEQRSVFSTNATLKPKLLDSFLRLHLSLVVCPNMIMFFAFVFWGVSEGFLYETVSCCALYILRPLMVICVSPYLKKNSVLSVCSEFLIFMMVYFSVLLGCAWRNIVHYGDTEKITIIAVFGVVILLFVIYTIYLLTKDKKMPCQGEICEWMWGKLTDVAAFIFFILPSLQFILLFAAFGARGGGVFVTTIFPLFFFLSISCLAGLNKEKSCSNLLNLTSWMIFMFIMTAVLVYLYITTLKNEKDGAGWTCTAVFAQVLWMTTIYIEQIKDLDLILTFRKMLYVFGSVGVVLLNSVTLMTELILTTINGERAVGDLRVVVFSSESIFAFSLLIFSMFEPWISDMKCLQCCQKTAKTDDIPVTESNQNQDSQNAAGSDESSASGSNQNQIKAESHEMIPLLNQDQEAGGRSNMMEENQLDSVETQTLSTLRSNTMSICSNSALTVI